MGKLCIDVPQGMTHVIWGFKQEGPARRGRIMGRWINIGFVKCGKEGEDIAITFDAVSVSGLRGPMFARPVGSPPESPPEDASDDLNVL